MTWTGLALVLLTPASGWASSASIKGFGLGIAAGATSGIGLSARLALDRGFGLSLTGMPFILGYRPRRGGTLGLQATWDFFSARRFRVYTLVGTQVFISRYDYQIPFRNERVRRRYDSLVAGPGVGMELRRGRLAFNLDVALAGVFALRSSTQLRYPGRVNVGVFPNVAICFYFGPQWD